MPKYLLSGKDAQGRQATELVTAPNTNHAVRKFKGRGFSDVVLHPDEVIGHLFRPEVLENLTPRDYLALGRLSRGGFLWQLIVRLYRKQSLLHLLFVALIVGRRVLEESWGLVDNLALAFLFFPLVVVLGGELFSPSRKFERAMTFNAWGRWAEMLAALPSVRHFVPAPQYAFFEAKALAGLGRLDEAMETVRPFADDPDLLTWLYWAMMADLFHAAKLGDRAIECGERALEHAPENVTVLLDLAMSRLRYRRDTLGARSLIERTRQHEISEVIRPFLLMTEGVLALEERRPEDARQMLEESVKLAEPLRHTTALMGVAIDRIHTYLSLAYAATGDAEAAEKHFRIAEPRMRAFRSEDLLERCQAALGHRA